MKLDEGPGSRCGRRAAAGVVPAAARPSLPCLPGESLKVWDLPRAGGRGIGTPSLSWPEGHGGPESQAISGRERVGAGL